MSASSEPVPGSPVIWDAAEQLPRAELRALQLERLRTAFGVELESLDGLGELPFTDKRLLRGAYPFGLLRVPVASLARLHASSGTHGKPTVVGYTAADLEAWTDLMARCMTMAGVRPGMLIHNANTYGLFTGGHGFHQGAERIGAPVLPVSGGFTARQAMLLHDLGAQVLVSTPSYALVIAQAVQDAGIDPATLQLELGLFGGEPWTDGLREQIERALPGLRAVNFYGLSEMCGPGVATECLEIRDGLHVHEDHFLVEVVDPGSGVALGEGAEGELVFTTLVKEAMPMLRYRTGDIASLTFEPCGCGRTTARIRGLRGRRDDMIVVRGVNVYPSNVEHALLSVPQAAPHYQLIVERPGSLDELTVQCEPAGPTVDVAALRVDVERAVREQLGIRVRAEVVEPGAVPRSEGKAVRLVDRR
jgi:phenylacetate-CoA ligase